MSGKDDGLYWTPLGGNDSDEIRANCQVFSSSVTHEDGSRQEDVILVDLGADEVESDSINRVFKSVIPALDEYLGLPGHKSPLEKATALFLTHSHVDHMGGISGYLEIGAKLPPIYASEFTLAMLKKEIVDKGIDLNLLPELHAVRPQEKIQIGAITIEPTQAPHSIPGSLGFKISNKVASVYHSGDVKADTSSYLGEPMNLKHMAEIGKDVDFMLCDATSAVKPGFATREEEICAVYTQLFQDNPERQIVSLIKSSHMERFATVLKAAENAGKNVVIQGGSEMQVHLMGLQSTGISLNSIAPGIKVLNHTDTEALNLDPKNTVIISSGIEGNEEAPFFKTLRHEKTTVPLQDDAVIIAPLSGKKADKFKQALYAYEGTRFLSFIDADSSPEINGSGHAQKEDFKQIVQLINPKFIAPVHCRTKKANDFNKLAASMGYKVFSNQVQNGETVRISAEKGAEIYSYKPAMHFVLWEEEKGNTKKVMKRFQSDKKMPGYIPSPRSFEERRAIADSLIGQYNSSKKLKMPKTLLQYLVKKEQNG